jgi:hypothetical protein
MLLGNIRKGLLVFLSLLVASAAIAAPTVGDCNRYSVVPLLSPSPDSPTVQACEINQIGEPTNSPIASVAAEFLKPPTDTNLQALPMQVKPLPPVPGALFLGLAGFLCVSLVKDRRVWLAALAGLLWLGQTGFTALPQLASHLRSKKQIQQSSPTLIYISELEGSFRPCSNFVIRNSLFDIHYSACCISSPSDRSTFSQREDRFRLPQFATAPPALRLIQTNFCSAVTAEQILPFSPAFIFSRLARGPPERA